MKHIPTFENFLNEEEILNEDSSLALFLILQAAVINGMLIGQMAARSGGDGFHPIDDLKAWWAKRKKDKAVQSIIDKLKDDPDVIAFMSLSNSAQRGKWYKLIAPKLNDEEQKYLTSISRTPFMNEDINEGTFVRLPKDKKTGDDFYIAKKNLEQLYDAYLAGQDFDDKWFDETLKHLEAVKKSAKKFNKPEEIAGTIYESLDEAYKQVPYNVKISGQYEISINSKVVKTSIAGFERENDDSDSLYLMDNDPLKAEHGSFIVKNSDMPKLEKGTVVNAVCSKHSTPATLKRIGDL